MPAEPKEVGVDAGSVELDDWIVFEDEDENAPEVGNAPPANRIARRATETTTTFFRVEKKSKEYIDRGRRILLYNGFPRF